MKVVKDNEHALLFKTFGLRDRLRLAVTVMTFFDFHNPDQPLSEADLWKFVPGEIGKETILDEATPKPRAEAIVWGRCFAPGGKPVPAATVSFRVGELSKSLSVFGDRFWKKSGGVVSVITDPVPFAEMEVSWKNAFGGAGFERNPEGKGIAPVVDASGEEVFPLPNVERPGRLIGLPTDEPEPAGLRPLDMMRPQRARKAGTYDDRWLRERWPYYPDDMDWTFFNAAPEDQQQAEYFQGGESLAVEHMHPTKTLVASHLPALRQRCFIRRLADRRKPKGDWVFVEAPTRIDTVWLFPHAERGIVIHRGTAEVFDDEARDVLQLFVAAEAPGEAPKPKEFYLEALNKRLDKKVKIDPAPKEEAKKKLAEARIKLKDLPNQIQDQVAQAKGEAPRSARTPAQVLERSKGMLAAHGRRLADGEARTLKLKEKYGHLMKIDTSGFERARGRLEATGKKLDEISAKIGKAEAKTQKVQAKVVAGAEAAAAKLPQADLAAAGLDPAALAAAFRPAPRKLWRDEGMRFLEDRRDDLLADAESFAALRKLGLRPYTVKRRWLGLNSVERRLDPAVWGLERKPGDSRPLVIGPGLLIPRFNKADLESLAVRPGKFTDSIHDKFVEGSEESPYVLGAAEGKPFIFVAGELEAILLDQEAGAFAAAACLCAPDDKPDQETAACLKSAPQILVVLYPNEKPESIEEWRAVYPQAEALPLSEGKTLFEARAAGLDLARWVADALKPELAPELEEEAEDLPPGGLALARPKFDAAALVAEVTAAHKAKAQPKLDKLEANKQRMLGKVRGRLAEQGRDLDDYMKPPSPSIMEGNPFVRAKEKFARSFASSKENIRKAGGLTEETEAKLTALEGQCGGVLDGAAERHDAGMAKIAAARKAAKAGPPDWAKKLMAGAGLDPDDPTPLKLLTREEVVERYQAGKSLAGKNLAGADLSNLELPGIDLRKAQLQKANLSGTNLEGADLSRALAGEADLSKARLKGAVLVRCLLQKGKLAGADLSGADLGKAILSEADLSGADLSGAVLEKALLEKAVLAGARLQGAKAGKGYFLSTDLSDAALSEADLTKAVFMKAKVDRADFSRTTARSAQFWTVAGEKVRFSGADLHNARICGESALPGADFTHCRAERSCWMKSDLSGGKFHGANLGRALVEECGLAGADLAGAPAKGARFNLSDLTGADLRGLNLHRGSLRKARLAHADLGEANLYGAEFFKTGVGETNLDGANLKMTKLKKIKDLLP